MAVYSAGSVNIKVGSATIIGNSTDFLNNISVGDIFKRTSEGVYYTVAGVVSATKLTLSSRYANTDNQTDRPSENIATITTATKMYSGTLDYNPCIQNTISINASVETFTDDGAGVLTGDGSPAGSGTIDYDTTAWSITLGTDIGSTAVCTASYTSGDNMNGMNYQIYKDYTPHKSFPEMSTTDLNIAHIYTKALRQIDLAFYKDNVKNAATDYTATDTDHVINYSGSLKATITLPPATAGNIGRRVEIINSSASDLIATCYATPAVIKGVGISVVSSTLGSQYETLKVVLATTNTWVKD